MSGYAELHCHSSFSLLDGVSDPQDLVDRAMELGLPALALTDHNEVGGAVRFAAATARTERVQGILGAELTVDVPLPAGLGADAARLPWVVKGEDQVPRLRTHLVCLAESRVGWGNLCTLITQARCDHPRGEPRVTFDQLAAHAAGLSALTGCPRGWVPQLVTLGQCGLLPRDEGVRQARDAAGRIVEAFGGRLAVECWDHAIPEERDLVRELIPLAKRLGVPWVVTNDVHYARPRGRMVHDVLAALRHGATLDEMGTKLRPNGEWYLKGYGQLAARWSGMEEGLAATLAIAERCTFRLDALKATMPRFPLPPGVSADAYLAELVWQGAEERWVGKRTPEQDRQLRFELDLIAKLDLAGYFLIVWDIARFARRSGIHCQGRGSAANSAVCYCLNITSVDPIAQQLLFARFLSDGRTEMPDIDIDFAHRERERVIQYVYDKYGRDHAAMVCEQICWRGRSAVRDGARVLGFSPEQAGVLAVLGDRHSAKRSAEVLRKGNAEFDSDDPRMQHLAGIVEGLDGLPRHRGIHVGGFVLTEEPLYTVVPIEPASMEERTIIPWEKDDLDLTGLVKIDLLGLGMLTVLQDCLAYIRRTRGETIDLGQLDYADPAIYDDLCAADTVGVFQVESRAQMNTLPRLRPRCFYDIVVEVALIRPGPIQGEMVHPYLRRRAKLEPLEYLHPSLEPILARTLGVPLFQEQGMQVAIAAAGFTPSEADYLRRAMAHRRSHRMMQDISQRMLDGMAANGIAPEVAKRIYHQIQAFADYGFPESHATSFAQIVYSSAWLRHYYAPEFACAILNAQPMGFYAPGTLIEDAKRHGVEFLPVDVTRSDWDHTLEPGDGDGAPPVVRLGVRVVQGLGAKARGKLELLATGTRTPFTSIADFVHRTMLDRRSLRALAEAGAFDAFVRDEPFARRRRVALWRVLEAEREAPGPLALFPESVVPPHLPAFAPPALTEADYRLTGLSLNGHPMQHVRATLAPNGVRSARELLDGADGDPVAYAGLVICRQRPQTAKGFVFLTLEDETGTVNVIITPQRYERQALLISRTPLLLVRGILQVEDGVRNIRAGSFAPLRARAGEDAVRSHDFH